MIKLLSRVAVAALLAFLPAASFADTGTPPQVGGGPALIDQTWLNGLAGGLNNSVQSGITAAGTTQATATQLASGIALIQIDTTAASTGVNLPQCIAGARINLYNAGAQTLTVYPKVSNNPITAAQDTINGTTSFTIATTVAAIFFCPKNGSWAAK